MTAKEKVRTGSGFSIPELWPERAGAVLGVDPGTKHCGMALLQRVLGDDWELQDCFDLSPVDCVLHVQDWLRSTSSAWLVVEGYQLYPDKMQQQGMSRMGTPEVIGALKWVYLETCWFRTSGATTVAFAEQGASIKAAGRRWMDLRGVVEEGSNQHKRDAEAHAWHRVRKILEAESRAGKI